LKDNVEQPRYAVYYAPDADTPLWRFGCAALGYDAETGAEVASFKPQSIAGLDWRATASEPRRYGFHATLKAPFYLIDGADESALIAAVAALADDLRAAPLGPLRVRALGSFVALTSGAPREALSAFAQRVVEALERFRAPLSPADMARRLESPLTPRQKELLLEFGYPYVSEEFRFHMTLTGPLHFEARPLVEAALRAIFEARVGQREATLDQLAVFRQDRRDLPFRIIRRVPLRAP